MDRCPCDTCKFKDVNFNPPNRCPNFDYFYHAFVTAYNGGLKTDPCEKWEGEDDQIPENEYRSPF